MTTSSVTTRDLQSSFVSNTSKAYYQEDQQDKLMHLQAEIDYLFQQLQSLKQQKSGIENSEN
jgi:hypothetical protein